MALTRTQEAFLTKVLAVGGSEIGVALDNEICTYLIALIASDLNLLGRFPELPRSVPPFFGNQPLSNLRLTGRDFRALFERIVELRPDVDAYFYCLATLHKARLKYERILQAQPIPTMDQVGPRGLLQFGNLSARALAALLLWRKWIYDIDNRSAQETGYVFEPIIAHAMGGVPASAKRSPVRRGGSGTGRQVDCIRETDKRAYEIKLRVTIAASGQGRWAQELEFPVDARASGYTPVLIVLDPTANPKLTELSEKFRAQRGEVFVGADAWNHLEQKAGITMAVFLEKYVRVPLQSLLSEAPDQLPELVLRMTDEGLVIIVGGEEMRIPRQPKSEWATGEDDLPPDADGYIPAP